MKLTELLEQISALPWTEEGPCRTTEQQRAANLIYRVHAANALPELVKAVSEIVTRHRKLSSGPAGCPCGYCKVLKPALSAAEEIKS